LGLDTLVGLGMILPPPTPAITPDEVPSSAQVPMMRTPSLLQESPASRHLVVGASEAVDTELPAKRVGDKAIPLP
jgi:hypothetical protein